MLLIEYILQVTTILIDSAKSHEDLSKPLMPNLGLKKDLTLITVN